LAEKINDFRAILVTNFESICNHAVEKFVAKICQKGQFQHSNVMTKEV